MIKIIDRIVEVFIILLMIIFFQNATGIGQIFFGGLLIWYIHGWLKDYYDKK